MIGVRFSVIRYIPLLQLSDNYNSLCPQEAGVSSFYSGFVPRLARRTLVSATAWLVYEEVKKKSYLFPTSRVSTY